MPYPYQPYTYSQTLDTVDLSFPVPPGSRSRDIEVKWEPSGVIACVKHQPPTIKGEFFAPIKSKNSIWQLEGNTVTLHIEKADEDIWPFVIKPGLAIDPCSQFLLADAMEEGRGLPRDASGAFELFKESADNGMEAAQLKVAYVYSGLDKSFDSVEPNDSQAFTYFSYAANQHGNPEALLQVGNAFHLGTGVDKSPKMAESFYKKAAALKNITAVYNLGVLYRSTPESSEFKPDPKKAFQFFQAAAELGNVDACHSLGVAYFGGDVAMIGEETNLYKAKEYFEKAAELSKGQYRVPKQILQAIQAQEEAAKAEARKKAKAMKKKLNGTAGVAAEAREKGKSTYMAGMVALGLITVFGLHWLSTRK